MMWGITSVHEIKTANQQVSIGCYNLPQPLETISEITAIPVVTKESSN